MSAVAALALMVDRISKVARLVHGAACVGAPVEQLLRTSGASRRVVLLAMGHVDPDGDDAQDGALTWVEVLGVLQDVLERCDRD